MYCEGKPDIYTSNCVYDVLYNTYIATFVETRVIAINSHIAHFTCGEWLHVAHDQANRNGNDCSTCCTIQVG